jgi:hypothetical protein
VAGYPHESHRVRWQIRVVALGDRNEKSKAEKLAAEGIAAGDIESRCSQRGFFVA